jgi:hypothetical protein
MALSFGSHGAVAAARSGPIFANSGGSLQTVAFADQFLGSKPMNDEASAKFARAFRGALIGRNDPVSGDATKLYNAMIDKRPLLIARCADVADLPARGD